VEPTGTACDCECVPRETIRALMLQVLFHVERPDKYQDKIHSFARVPRETSCIPRGILLSFRGSGVDWLALLQSQIKKVELGRQRPQ
jgi:hypothetical protein